MVVCDNRGIQYVTEMKLLLQSLFKKESTTNLNILNMPIHTLYMYHHHLIVDTFLFNPIETIVAFMRRAIAFLSGPWAHICDENKGFTQTPVTFLS